VEVPMIALETVLCPVDFSPATPRQVDLAAELCRAFGARLVLLHNSHALGAGANVGWMWNADHKGNDQAAVEAKLRDCVSRVPDGVSVEPLMTEGPVARTVLTLAEAVNADLVVLTAHGTMADDHASITQQVLEDGRRAVLVLHEPAVEPRTPHFASQAADRQVVVAPTDLGPKSRPALEVGFELARALPIELHLLHLLPNGRTSSGSGPTEEEALGRMRALVPEELAGRVKLHVEHDDVARGIAAAADRLSAVCIVMGEHTRTPLRRWFSGGTSRAVLQQAHCPVWYVPAKRAAPPVKPVERVGPPPVPWWRAKE
jgi:nucleotide-binding universal stress UspA family protein